MKLATATSRRDAVSSSDHQSHKSGGTDSTEDDRSVLDPAAAAAAVFAPDRGESLLDQALARIGSDASPPSSATGGWRQKFGVKKWRGGSNNNNKIHRRSKSADASSTTMVPPWLAHTEIVSLADSQTIVASPNASKQASELFKAASRDEQDDEKSQQNDEEEAVGKTTSDETAINVDDDPAAVYSDRVTIDFRELSKEDAAKLLPLLEMKAGKRPSSESHSKQQEGKDEETAGAPAASANKEATLFERLMANATCGQCNCAEEIEKGVEMIAMNDSLLDDTDDDDDESDEQDASVTDVEVSLASPPRRKKLWSKKLWPQKAPPSASTNLATNIRAGDSAGGMATVHFSPDDNEAQEEVVLQSFRSSYDRKQTSKRSQEEEQQPQQYDEDDLDALAERMATPPRSPPKLKRQGSKIVADLVEGPPEEAEGKGLEVLADLSPIQRRVDSRSTDSPAVDAGTKQIPTVTPPRHRSKLDPRCFIDIKSKKKVENVADDKVSINTHRRSRSSDTPFTNAETELVNNRTPLRRSKLDPRCFIETKSQKNSEDNTTAPSEIVVEEKNPVIERRLAKRSPSVEYLEERCNSNIVLTTSPFRTKSTMAVLSSLSSDEKTEDPVMAKVRANVNRMRSIAARSQDGGWEEDKLDGASKNDGDNKCAAVDPENLLTPRRSNLALDDKERVKRNISRMRSIAGLSDIPIVKVSSDSTTSSSPGNGTQKKTTRCDILKSSPHRSRSTPDREQHSTGSTKTPMKLQDYIRGRYSKNAPGYLSLETRNTGDEDEYEMMSIEQEYEEHEEDHEDEEHYEQEDHEDRDAAKVAEEDDVKMLQFAVEGEVIEEASLETQDVSPMNLRSFLKPRGRSINFQSLRLRNKFRSIGKPPRDPSPSHRRSTTHRSLYDLRRIPGSEEDKVMHIRKDNDDDDEEVEITMTLEEDEEDDSRYEDETLGDETTGSNLQLLSTVPVSAHRSASSRRPWRRLRSLGSKVHP